MTMNRRKFITTTGAAIMAAPPFLSIVGWAWETPAEIKKCGIIIVVDETIPYLKVYEQFDISRTHNTLPGTPIDENLCFGLYGAGDGSKEYAKSCAETCNAWIAGMRRYGFVKVAVVVWSRRFGPTLTIPLKTMADVILVRTYIQPMASASTRPISSKFNQAKSQFTWLEGRMMRNDRPYNLIVEQSLNFEPIRFDNLGSIDPNFRAISLNAHVAI